MNHSASDQGKFYTVDPTFSRTVFAHGGLPKMIQKQAKTFAELCIMVRDPALEIINYIKHTDLSKPVNRYVLCTSLIYTWHGNLIIMNLFITTDGEKGAGKSLSLAHILHYVYLNDYLIVHLP